MSAQCTYGSIHISRTDAPAAAAVSDGEWPQTRGRRGAQPHARHQRGVSERVVSKPRRPAGALGGAFRARERR